MPRRVGRQGKKKKNEPFPGVVDVDVSLIPDAKDFQISSAWIPVTPVKPILPKPHPICTERRENQQPNWSATEPFSTGFERGNTAQGIVACALRNSMNKGFGNWEEPLEADFQVSGNSSCYREFTNLIALADAAVTTGDSANATHQANVNAVTGPFISIDSNGFQTRLGNQDISGANPALDTALCGNFFPSLATNGLDSPPRAFTDAFFSRSIPSQFAPITPDQSKKAQNKQPCDTENLDVDERSKHVRDKQGNEVLTTMVEVEVLHDNELQHLPKYLTGDAVSTQLDENHNPDKGGHPEIDLNRTPQQKPRRKKHRPKVVIEGQPKRSIKPVTPKPADSKANLTGKKRSVPKTELNKTPDTAATEVTSGSTDPKRASEAGNSCRRSLNFDYERQVREESSSCRPQSHINKESQAQNFYSAAESKSTMQLGQGMEVMVEKTQIGIAYDLTHSLNKVLEDYLSMPERQTPSPQTSTKTNQPQENLKVLVQNEDIRGKCQIVFLDETHDKHGSTKEVMMKTDNLSAPRSPNDSNCSSSTCSTEGAQARGLKRGHSCTIDEVEPSCTTVIGGHYNTLHEYMTMFPANIYDHNGIPGVHFPGICKKKRTEKVHSSSTSSPLSTLTTSEQNSRQATPFSLNYACAARYAPEINCRFSAAQFNSSSTSAKTASHLDAQRKQQTLECKLALDLKGRTMTKKRSKSPTRVRDLTSLIGIVGCRQLPTFPAGIAPPYGDVQEYEISNQPHTCMEALVADTRAAMTTKKRTKRNSYATTVITDEILKGIPTIDKLVEKLKSIDLNRERNQITTQGKGALVPYNLRYEEKNALVRYRRDGTVVPFEGSFDPVKKRRPRPKVDLDDETNRVWKLLLENINSEGIDGTNEEKAKWWEDERTVFRGRADSFIARMHLVQGDRRFSPWKGSIVDSVVGVFLTQNVSDHLSSSAFMSLAARFPLKSESGKGSCSEEKIVLAKEPEMHILEPEDTIKWHEEKSNQHVCETISMIIHDMDYNVEKEVVNSNELLGSSSADEKSTDNFRCESLNISGNGPEMYGKPSTDREMLQLKEAMASFMEDNREMDDGLTSQYSAGSSQNSVDSSMAQTAERISPCLQDNSETDLATWSNPNSLVGSFVELLQWAETSRGFYDHGTGNVSSCTENGHIYMESTECGIHKQNKDGSENPNASSCNNYHLQITPNSRVLEVESLEILEEESLFSDTSKKNEENCTSEQSGVTAESASQAMVQNIISVSSQETPISPSENNHACRSLLGEANKIFQSQNRPCGILKDNVQSETQEQNCRMQQVLEFPNLSRESLDITESTSVTNDPKNTDQKEVALSLKDQVYLPCKAINGSNSDSSKLKRARDGKQKQNTVDWDSLRLQAQAKGKRERTTNTMDSLDWEAVRCADVSEIANTIKERGMNNMLAERIKDFLNRLVREHGSIDLEWLRDIPPDKAKEYLLSIRGLGLKSVECVRLLTLHHLAFPVDTNVGRIAVRLGWVPLQPLPESLQLHLLELYPVLESIQRYLWPRLCKLDQRTLYELHYQMITFGKVFCTKSKPNCNACPMRGECRHFASAFASARLALPGPEEKSIVCATENKAANQHPVEIIKSLQLPLPEANQQLQAHSQIDNCEPVVEVPATQEPIIEVPATPEPDQPQIQESDIEDTFYEDPEEIPTIKLNIEEFTQNLQNYMQKNMELQEADMSKALVALTPEAASIPMPKLKNVSRLRTEHQVYELPDSHPLLEGLDKREPDDPCSYLLAIWTPGETANSIQPPEIKCSFQEFGQLCDEKTCFSCNSIREANSQTVRGTLLIPCRTAMKGSFPLNGTYFQVNEVFADHESSINPIDVPRTWIWNLPRRTVYFGTSIPTIFKGLTTESIQYCFWRGFVCVRGFDQKTRAPRPLMARLHFPASKLTKTKGKTNDKQE